MVIMFVDLKAAFDLVDRKQLVKTMREMRDKKIFKIRCEKVLTKIKGRIRVGEKEDERFLTTGKVRQKCPVSPCILTVIIRQGKNKKGRLRES